MNKKTLVTSLFLILNTSNFVYPMQIKEEKITAKSYPLFFDTMRKTPESKKNNIYNRDEIRKNLKKFLELQEKELTFIDNSIFKNIIRINDEESAFLLEKIIENTQILKKQKFHPLQKLSEVLNISREIECEKISL